MTGADCGRPQPTDQIGNDWMASLWWWAALGAAWGLLIGIWLGVSLVRAGMAAAS